MFGWEERWSDLWKEEKIRYKKNGWDVSFEGGRIGEKMVVIL